MELLRPSRFPVTRAGPDVALPQNDEYSLDGSVLVPSSGMDELLIVNLADAPAISHPRRATIIDFEPEDAPWPDTGVNI